MQINEKHYGVQSTFDQSLTGYTLQIQRADTQDFREAEAQAEKIANEIENQATYKDRAELENNDESEESRYAAVERPLSSSTTASGKLDQTAPFFLKIFTNSLTPFSPGFILDDGKSVGKYVAPGRRKNNNGKLITSRPSLNNSNNNIINSVNNSISNNNINSNTVSANSNSNAPDMPESAPINKHEPSKPSDSK